MKDYLLLALDWSEVWALMIPLAVLLFRRQQPASLKPIIIYLWLALVLNLAIDIIMAINTYRHNYNLSNNPLYNIQSVARFACFSLFFMQQPQPSFTKFKNVLAAAAIVFLVINFIFFENFFNPESLSGNLLATEAYLLLVYCMLFYLSELKDDDKNLFNSPHFWIVTGLGIYVVVNFFVFLFYIPMLHVNWALSVDMWNVHNIAYIIFCLFITKALYGPFRYQYSV